MAHLSMFAGQLQVAVLAGAVLQGLAAPQSRPYYTDAQGGYDATIRYPDAQASYDAMTRYPGMPQWQPQGPEPPAQDPQSPQGPQSPQAPTTTTQAPFIPSLSDAQRQFSGQVMGLPYPNFAGFPLYPFTPYASGQWWR